MPDNNIHKKALRAFLVILTVIAVGTVGFHFLLDLGDHSLIKALYLTVITLTTVGYGDLSPHLNMPAGTSNPFPVYAFTMALIIVGMGSFLYAIGIATEYIVSGQMARDRQSRTMRKRVARLDRHFILCGAGHIGTHIATELEQTRRGFIVVDTSLEALEALRRTIPDLLYIHGDATDDRVLQSANLERLAGIIAALPDEKDNLSIVISLAPFAAERGEAFRIAARAEDWHTTTPKLKRAGAGVVVCPEFNSARRMVSEMLRPSVTTFLDTMLRDKQTTRRIEEVAISEGSSLNGVTLADSGIRDATGLLVMGLRKKGAHEFIFAPDAAQRIEAGDVLIAAGSIKDIVALRKMADHG